MVGRELSDGRKLADVGRQLHDMAARLYPLARSQTGEGVRETLRTLRDWAPVEMREVPSGTSVFDWQVPPEWTLREAHVTDRTGRRVIDVARSTLHLVNGSVPVRATLTWDELAPRLHALPDQPDRVPYRTGFFRDEWGFCLSQRDRDAIREAGLGPYEVVVDTELSEGSLTYGELVLPGETEEEMLFSAHVCHPSLANDNLSGIVVAAMLARVLAERPRRLTYRFVWAPATIGAIAWLATNRDALAGIRHGLVLTLLGDAHPFTYKRTRAGDAPVDRAVAHVLATGGEPYEIDDFVPWGYDERQYASPGIDLPVGCLMRSRPGEFAEYHTSGDDLDFITPASLERSFETVLAAVEALEGDAVYRNTRPHGEPRLDRHGLYRSLPEDADVRRLQQAVQWVLNQSDGRHSLLDIAERAGMAFGVVKDAADRLEACGLLERVARPLSSGGRATRSPQHA